MEVGLLSLSMHKLKTCCFRLLAAVNEAQAIKNEQYKT